MIRMLILVALLLALLTGVAQAGVVDDLVSTIQSYSGGGVCVIHGPEGTGGGPTLTYKLVDRALGKSKIATSLDLNVIAAVKEGGGSQSVVLGLSGTFGQVGKPTLVLGLAATGDYGRARLSIGGRRVFSIDAAPYIGLNVAL